MKWEYGTMANMKRIFLFLTVNLAVMFLLMLVVNVILSFAGPDVREAMYHNGIDMLSLSVFSLVFGMGGAIISLLISKPMAKWSVGAQVVDGSEGEQERWLVATVERLSRSANIKMPEVAVYRGSPNAFATGAFKNSAFNYQCTDDVITYLTDMQDGQNYNLAISGRITV
jgi:heat shock protein HtpX